ncbi:MAG: family 78 glycoside hydrolase catalytic domain [Kiritimatiellae bacterium]|nr:family 78 glycoside hydrolase catalytic domain [Kiritimatiellia bacterium]
MKKVFFLREVSLASALLLTVSICHAELTGKWIGYDSVTWAPRVYEKAEVKTSVVKLKPDGTSWIWLASEKQLVVPGGTCLFRKTVSLPKDIKIKSGSLLITADNAFALRVNGKDVSRGSEWERLNYADAAKHLKPGDNVIEVDVTNDGGQPGPAALLFKMEIVSEEGKKITVLGDDSWEAKRSNAKEMGKSRVIGKFGCHPWGTKSLGGSGGKSGGLVAPPPRYLRKEFALKDKVKKATLKASALGWYNVHINGQMIGDDYFAPGWTDYNKRVYYNTYDVTDMLQKGNNAVGAILADGWYSGYIGWGRKRNHYGKNIRFMAQVEVEYSDGSTETIITDESWKATADGPLDEADILMGERYDARKEMPGWDKAKYDDSAWKKVDVTESIKAKIEPFPTVTVKKFRELKPLSVKEPLSGSFVYDLGSNFAGFARLKVQAPKGTEIKLAFGEMLLPNGDILKSNLRGARAEDTYICKGEGVEVWEPRFTFHGFQYVRMTGYPGTPDKDAVTGIEVTSATRVVGSFECSDERLNKLYRNIIQTQRANFIDIPTDCPQRDERLGWTGDAQAYIRTACLNMDVQSFFHKWLVDLEDSQLGNGDYPCVVPRKVAGGSGGPAWADAGIICPWAIYEVYGDKSILEKQYDSMARFMAYRDGKMQGNRISKFHCFGDWLNIGANTPKDVIFVAYTAGNAQIMSKVADILGKQEDVEKYNKMHERFKKAFNEMFVGEDGKIKGHTQTCYILALGFDLVDGEMKKKVEEHLIERIEERKWHLSTGFVGTRDLMHVLTKIGRNDIAYRLLFNDTYPSWLFPVKNGATSIWERWDSWTPNKGFQSAKMNSFSHYAYGAIGQWMFENIGGIRHAEPGYKKISIKPIITDKLDWAKVSYDSIQGMISVNWEREGDKVNLEVEIPEGAKAEVYVPGKDKPENVKAGKHKFKGKM